MRYGCHDLRRNDRDGDPAARVVPVWGGTNNPPASLCPAPGPAIPVGPAGLHVLAVPQYVRQLQEDLRTLGFSIVGTPSGIFDRFTFWAVREFQIYASMATVARVRPGLPPEQRQGAHLVTALGEDAATNLSVYVNSLEAVANGGAGLYAGSKSGVVNSATRDAIDHWLDNNFRCPVIIEAWRVRRGARDTLVASNAWAHDSVPDRAPRFFARDFTGYYTLPAGHDANAMQVIGDFATFLGKSGPRAEPPNHVIAEGEILPEPLTGVAAPAGATLSSYRVIRSVCEVECIGFFDCVNSFDNAFVSVGPCHWTLGIVTAGAARTDRGELCGYLAYLRDTDNAAFLRAFENFGARIDEEWTAGGVADGAALFTAQHKFAAWITLQNEAGNFVGLPRSEDEGNYFKTWHWHYRFVMAGRTIEGYRRRMWHMARTRVRDILRAPWGAGVAQIAVAGGTPRDPTIGDVFTSECAVACILRWHIRSPGHVINARAAGRQLRSALDRARADNPTLVWNGDPSGWTDAHETALLDALLAVAPANVRDAFNYLRAWPNWLPPARNPRGFTLAPPIAAALLRTRNSFSLDRGDLPPEPPPPAPRRPPRPPRPPRAPGPARP
jgi:hypothetical protein